MTRDASSTYWGSCWGAVRRTVFASSGSSQQFKGEAREQEGRGLDSFLKPGVAWHGNGLEAPLEVFRKA